MICEGTTVPWKWDSGWASGEVQQTFTGDVSRTIDGNQIHRHCEDGNKALLIKQ